MSHRTVALPIDLHFPLSLDNPTCGGVALGGDASVRGPVPDTPTAWKMFEGFVAAGLDEACQDVAGRPAQSDGRTLCCLADRTRVERIRTDAAALVKSGIEGMILDRPGAWWSLGPRASAFCARCRDSLGAHLVAAYGAHFVGFDSTGAIGKAMNDQPAAGLDEIPFGKDREVWRLRAAVEAVASVVRRARDEARMQNRPLAVGARVQEVSPVGLSQARFLDLCLYPAPAPGWPARTAIGVHELIRAAMGPRPASALMAGSGAMSAVELLSAAALCTALRVDLCPDGPLSTESCAALTAFRAWVADVRKELRPRAGVAEVSLLYSLESDLWSGGRHRAAVLAAAEALTALGVQYVLRMDLAGWGSEPLVLCAASTLSETDARKIKRKVEAGGAAIVIGALGGVDDDGRIAPAPFPDPKPGLTRKGDGNVYGIAPGDAPMPSHEALAAELSRGLGAALGKGRRAVALAGAAAMVARAYLDPERKLDVHFANLDRAPVRGATVQLTGAIAGAGRKAFLLRPGKEPEKVALTPSGFGVTAVLPDIDRYALLTVPR